MGETPFLRHTHNIRQNKRSRDIITQKNTETPDSTFPHLCIHLVYTSPCNLSPLQFIVFQCSIILLFFYLCMPYFWYHTFFVESFPFLQLISSLSPVIYHTHIFKGKYLITYISDSHKGPAKG